MNPSPQAFYDWYKRTLENPKYRWILAGGTLLYLLSPITQFVEAFRDVLYDLEVPSAGRLLGLTVVSLAVFLLGFAYFQRGSRDVAELL